MSLWKGNTSRKQFMVFDKTEELEKNKFGLNRDALENAAQNEILARYAELKSQFCKNLGRISVKYQKKSFFRAISQDSPKRTLEGYGPRTQKGRKNYGRVELFSKEGKKLAEIKSKTNVELSTIKTSIKLNDSVAYDELHNFFKQDGYVAREV